jgi:AraC family transcriptional activator of pobA
MQDEPQSPLFNKGQVPENIRRLRPLEQEFKHFYETTGLQTSAAPLTMDDFTALLEEQYPDYRHLNICSPVDFTESLSEDQYFQTQLDVAAIESLRYVPALLHRHQFFEVACVLSGNVKNFNGSQAMDLCTGDILIMPPDSSHGICTYEDDCIMINILIRATTFEHHFLNLLPKDDILYGFFVNTLYGSSDTPYLLFRTGDDVDLREQVLRILQESGRNNRYKNTMLTSLLSVFFVDLMRNHEKDVVIPILNESVMNQDTIFIIEYMQKNFSTITLRHLAAFFNYSERQMQRIIRTATGLSFTGNIRKIRLNHAKELLSTTPLSVQEIADYLGYYDTSGFRHAFRSGTGMAPQEFRELYCQPIPETGFQSSYEKPE